MNIRHGLLMLVPEALEVLGGTVDEMEAARQRLVNEINKPPRGKRYIRNRLNIFLYYALTVLCTLSVAISFCYLNLFLIIVNKIFCVKGDIHLSAFCKELHHVIWCV